MGTYMTGPLETGTGLDSHGVDTGRVILSQTFLINRVAAQLVNSTSIILPANAQIVDFFVDVLTAYDSATSATLTIGTAAAGTQYVTSVNAKTGGRNAVTHTAAQATAMSNIGTNTAVFGTVTSVGQPTVGQVRVTVLYVQN